MNPLKNNFGMKLTLSILELFFCNPITLVAGILGCVFTANANASFKNGRLEDFKKQTKAATISLCVGAIGAALGIIFIIAFLVKADFKSDQLTGIKTYNEFQLNGKQITLPISMQDFEKLGFSLTDASDADVINPGETQMEMFTDKKFKETYIGTVILSNPKSTVVPQSQAIVTGMEIMKVGIVKTGKLTRPKLHLLDGITMESTLEEVIAVYGEADEVEDVRGDNTSVKYIWHKENYRQNFYDVLSIHYIKGDIISVNIQYSSH